MRQIILNIIMTIPFGFLLPLVAKKMNLIKVVLITMTFSLSIEFFQFFSITYRATDITDVITNTLGGLIGYCLYKLFHSLFEY
ncbi:VanZ family protein [Sharpea porci]|nr:VanZ family protein [Sharpea porci]